MLEPQVPETSLPDESGPAMPAKMQRHNHTMGSRLEKDLRVAPLVLTC